MATTSNKHPKPKSRDVYMGRIAKETSPVKETWSYYTMEPTFFVVPSAAELLGGATILNREVDSPLAAHELLQHGIPSRALVHLVDRVGLLRIADAFEMAVGMSQRTLYRRKDKGDMPLSTEHSGRTWKFAEILAKASAVFGSQERAEAWLQEPAVSLDQHTPLELLTTAAGVELVEQHLGRLEHGVYT